MATPAASSRGASPPAPPECHLAQGVTPSDPARTCDPCSVAGDRGSTRTASAIHLEQAGFLLGVQALDVDPHGLATWTKRGPDPAAAPRTWRAQLTPAQLAALVDALAADHLCAQRSTRFGIPDESTLLVDACLPGVACEIMLWQGEWEDRPDARAALGAIDAIIDDVVKRGATP
jgi:hypothetical protein